MENGRNGLIITGVVLAVVVVLLAKQAGKKGHPAAAGSPPVVAMAPVTNVSAPGVASPKTALPRLVDLGAGKCIPCKMMTPVLADLEKTYVGQLTVEFIDVWENPEEAELYKINLIPTQIFYDAAGKERFRHEGFFSKEDILAKWKEFGVNLELPGKVKP